MTAHVSQAMERLALAAMNLRSARRRITREYVNPERELDPLPPLDGALDELDRARQALLGDMHGPRRWARLEEPADHVRKVRHIEGAQGEWERVGEGGHYWASEGWPGGVPWAQVLAWGAVEDITDGGTRR